jgi:hypothetical protein
VGAWELIAAVTTTSSTTSTTSTTTTTIAQVVGGQGDGGGEVWAALFGALVGALVGGLTTLTGSVIVNRLQLKKSTRVRMYDDLLPAIAREHFDPKSTVLLSGPGHPGITILPPTRKFVEYVGELHRAGVIAGKKDASLTRQILDLIGSHIAWDVGGETYTPAQPMWYTKDVAELRAMDKRLDELTEELAKYLAEKIG